MWKVGLSVAEEFGAMVAVRVGPVWPSTQIAASKLSGWELS